MASLRYPLAPKLGKSGVDLNLNGQRVAVFGAGNGIGRAIAEAFLAEGCQVKGFDLDPGPNPLPPGGSIFAGDVLSADQIKVFAQDVGDLDHVVYSVGIGSGKYGFPFWNLAPADWDQVLKVNLMGAVNVAHALVPQLVRRGRGSLLFLVSVAGQIGSQTDPPYSAAKAALINFMQCAAKDLAPYGVRANALSPGMVPTHLNASVWAASQSQLPESARTEYATWAAEKIRRVSPLGRWQMPEEFGAMAVFLASDQARNITGQTINIDGGQVMHS
jgi:glucose 1-dehydrogenase/sorbitol-6-phosphate 2-dehydrogenase